MESLKKLAKNGLVGLAKRLNLSSLKNAIGRDLYVVNYHSIAGADSDPYINRNIYRTVSEFEDDIRFLSRNFSVFSAVDLIDMIASNKPFPKDTLVITFDDGLKINLEYQVPILKQYHITATFFLCSAFVDNKDLHYKRKVNLIVQKLLNEKDEALLRTIVEYLSDNQLYRGDVIQSLEMIPYKDRAHLESIASLAGLDFHQYLAQTQPYLDSRDVAQMLGDGFTIGAHSIDHPRYDVLTLEEQVEQTVKSVEFVKSKFRLPYRMFAFPHDDGVADEEFFRRIRPHVDLTFGMGGFVDNSFKFNIQRGEVETTQLPVEDAMKYKLIAGKIKSFTGRP